MVTGRQLRTARMGLGLGVRELASEAGVSANTVLRAEAEPGIPNIKAKTLALLIEALEKAGAEFGDDGSVRIR
jgi:hypothetical protein